MPIPKFRVLMIEDDSERAVVLESWLPEDVIVVLARSAGQALGILERDQGSVYAGIMLDHDLQMQTITESDKVLSGTDIVDAIIRNIDRRTPILVHSHNRTRAPIMASKLSSAGFWVIQIFIDKLAKADVRDWAEDAREIWEDLWDE